MSIYNNEITCPYCEWNDNDSHETLPDEDDDGIIECPECEKNFHAVKQVIVEYISTKLCEENDTEHDWKDFNFVSGSSGERVKGKRCEICEENKYDDV